jgi:hypothetical protein
MDESKRARPGRFAALIVIAVLAGCTTPVPQVSTKTETEIAVSEIPVEWLQGCDAVSADIPKNEVGTLLLDYTELAEAYAASCRRYKSLSDYLREVVKKERVLPANPQRP